MSTYDKISYDALFGITFVCSCRFQMRKIKRSLSSFTRPARVTIWLPYMLSLLAFLGIFIDSTHHRDLNIHTMSTYTKSPPPLYDLTPQHMV